MKTINYDDRSKFYDNEVIEDNKIINFIKIIKEKYNINTINNCPCASGIYLNTFAATFEKSYFSDINENMINEVNKKIKLNNFSNVKGLVIDMNDLDKVSTDAVIMLNQGLQYIDLISFEKLINKISHRYLILDLFDFTKSGKLTYFDSNIPNNEFYKSKSFIFNNQLVNRYNKHLISDDSVEITYKYDCFDSTTSFTLFNYKMDKVLKIVGASYYKVIDTFNGYDMDNYDNNGHYILVLERQ